MTLKRLRKFKVFLIEFVRGILFFLPSSKRLRFNWNFGFMLGIILVLQLITGVFLVFFYSADCTLAFYSVNYLIVESNFGFILRLIHFNGASYFFLFLYLHFFKGLFFFSYRLKFVWFSGISLFLLIIAEAFIGYVLV